jgi:hypothetical protein
MQVQGGRRPLRLGTKQVARIAPKTQCPPAGPSLAVESSPPVELLPGDVQASSAVPASANMRSPRPAVAKGVPVCDLQTLGHTAVHLLNRTICRGLASAHHCLCLANPLAACQRAAECTHTFLTLFRNFWGTSCTFMKRGVSACTLH